MHITYNVQGGFDFRVLPCAVMFTMLSIVIAVSTFISLATIYLCYFRKLCFKMATRSDLIQLKKIRAEHASDYDFKEMYSTTGDMVDDPNLQFTITEETPIHEQYSRAMVENALAKVLKEFKLEFKVQPFQKEAVFQMVNVRNLRKWKTLVIYAALRVKEILTGSELVVLASEPTQNIIKEKLVDPLLSTASISMTGGINLSEQKDVVLSSSIEEVKSGVHKVIYGYKESFAHPVGEEIIDCFAESKSIGRFIYQPITKLHYFTVFKGIWSEN